MLDDKIENKKQKINCSKQRWTNIFVGKNTLPKGFLMLVVFGVLNLDNHSLEEELPKD